MRMRTAHPLVLVAMIALGLPLAPDVRAAEDDSEIIRSLDKAAATASEVARALKATSPLRDQSSPIVSGLAGIRLGASESEVERILLKQPAKKVDGHWVINEYKGTIIIGFASRRVDYVYVKGNFEIPKNLYPGMHISEFENVYGKERDRQTREYTADMLAMYYPNSRLVMFVDQASRIVRGVMARNVQ